MTNRDFAAELQAARAASDWEAHARIWDERCVASVIHDEAVLANPFDGAPLIPRFAINFPSYPVASMPVLPAALIDASWHDDICPSFTDEAKGVTLWIDYPNRADREFKDDRCRFRVTTMDTGTVEGIQDLFASDDIAAVLSYIDGVKTPDQKARAYGRMIVAIWAGWADANETDSETALDLICTQIEALDLHTVEGTIASPLNVFVRACLHHENPEDLTYCEMVESIEISLSL